MTERTVALIGVGLMGGPMVARLLSFGFRVQIWNKTASKCDPYVEQGAVAFDTAAKAASGAEIVITMLSDADAVREIYLGTGGVAAASKDAIFIDMSSQSPETSRALHSDLLAKGIKHLDAPVSGGVAGAEAGTLAIMVGGSKDVYEEASWVFEPMGNPFYLGEAGAGQVCKLVNQTIVHITIGAISEGLLLASALGVDAGKVREAISGGFCQSRILELHGKRMVERDFVPGGPLKFSVKDLGGALTEAGEVDLALPLTQSVMAQYRELVQSGLGDLDHSALLKAYEAQNAPHRVSPDYEDQLPD